MSYVEFWAANDRALAEASLPSLMQPAHSKFSNVCNFDPDRLSELVNSIFSTNHWTGIKKIVVAHNWKANDATRRGYLLAESLNIPRKVMLESDIYHLDIPRTIIRSSMLSSLIDGSESVFYNIHQSSVLLVNPCDDDIVRHNLSVNTGNEAKLIDKPRNARLYASVEEQHRRRFRFVELFQYGEK